MTDKIIPLYLSEPEINLVGAALAELPYKQVNGLLMKIQRQITDQIKKEQQPRSPELLNEAE